MILEHFIKITEDKYFIELDNDPNSILYEGSLEDLSIYMLENNIEAVNLYNINDSFAQLVLIPRDLNEPYTPILH